MRYAPLFGIIWIGLRALNQQVAQQLQPQRLQRPRGKHELFGSRWVQYKVAGVYTQGMILDGAKLAASKVPVSRRKKPAQAPRQ